MSRRPFVRPIAVLLWSMSVALFSSGCTGPDVDGSASRSPMPEAVHDGVASYYARSLEGRPTASGEHYDAKDMTAAHRTFPLGTRVRVTEPRTGKAVIVRINDRGPYVKGRTIDLSREAAERLCIRHDGVAPVTLQVVQAPDS